MTKNTRPTTATTASITMVPLANQSSSLPLSSMICNAAIHPTSRTRPTVSMGSLRIGDSRLW